MNAGRQGSRSQAIKAEAAEVIRSQIERITLTPDDRDGGLDIHLHGDLARILQFCEAGEHKTTTPRPWEAGA